jgi:hypothetical protein
LVINYHQKEIIVKRSSLSEDNFGALMTPYSKIGVACVDTVFGHESG